MGDYPEKVHGTDGEGKEVTASFKGDQTYISDGHKSDKDFWGGNDNKGHDHADGQGGYKDRGQYTGEGGSDKEKK